MNDLQSLLQVCRLHAEAGLPLALATVVHVQGSAYRHPGARMLIYPDGRRLGSISGGCLEADVVQRAQQVMATGEPHYVLYDTRVSNGDLIFELGCKGAVGILIEDARCPEVMCGLEFLRSSACERTSGAQATVFRAEGQTGAAVGERVMLRAGGAVQGCLSDASLMPLLLGDMAQAMQSGHAQAKTYDLHSGRVEILLEPIQPPLALLLCGAGQDAVPLALMARFLGWQVTVADHRPSMLAPERFPGAETVLETRPDAPDDHLTLDSRTAAVIMTHSYARDRAWLERLLPSPLRYIGLLGPRKRAEQLREELGRDGILCRAGLEESELQARLHSPTGLDIGTETPEEIALAVVAEIQAVFSGRSGGFLRERQGPIHSLHYAANAPVSETAAGVGQCPLSV